MKNKPRHPVPGSETLRGAAVWLNIARKSVAAELEEDMECFATTPIGNSAGLPETLPPWPPWRIRHHTADADVDDAAVNADVAAMYAAVNARLDVLDAAFDMEHAELWDTQASYQATLGTTQEEARRAWNLAIAKAKAHDGDFTLLRRMLPVLAKFLNPPRRRRGERRRRPDWSFKDRRLWQAIDDVYRIRQLWKRRFGRWKRPDSDDIQAEAIAGERHGLTEQEVSEAMKRGMPGLHGRRYKLPINSPI